MSMSPLQLGFQMKGTSWIEALQGKLQAVQLGLKGQHLYLTLAETELDEHDFAGRTAERCLLDFGPQSGGPI